MLKEFQNIGIPPTSVGGGSRNDGRFLASAGFCDPGSVRLWGLVAFAAPCGGKSGLPNVAAAWAVAASPGIAPAPPAARMLRVDNSVMFRAPFICACTPQNRSDNAKAAYSWPH